MLCGSGRRALSRIKQHAAKFVKINVSFLLLFVRFFLEGKKLFGVGDRMRRKHPEVLILVPFSLGTAKCPMEGDILSKSCATARQIRRWRRPSFFPTLNPPPPAPSSLDFDQKGVNASGWGKTQTFRAWKRCPGLGGGAGARGRGGHPHIPGSPASVRPVARVSAVLQRQAGLRAVSGVRGPSSAGPTRPGSAR